MSVRLSSDPPLAGLKVKITIHKAKSLLAKDRNLFGKNSSDPYAKVLYKGETIGKSSVKKKNLNPEWNYVVKHTVGADEGETIRNATSANSLSKPNYPSILLVLFDHDKGTADDVLGQVTIPISYGGIDKQWLTLTTGEPKTKYACKKTKGEVQVSIETSPYLLPDIVRGNVVPIKFTGASKKKSILKVGLGWEVTNRQSAIDLDVSCVAIGNKGEVMMNETVYFSNLQNPNGSIVHSGDEQEGKKGLGDGSDDREQITMDLNRLPDKVCAYVLVVTVATPGVDFSRVTSARVRISDGLTGVGLFAFRPAYEGENTALFVLRIARNKSTGRFGGKGSWSLGTIGDTNATARDFGSLIPEIKGYCRDLIPNLEIDPNERIAVMNKGVTVRVRDYTPERDVLPPVLAMGLAWDVTNGVNIDLDASAACLDAEMNLVDLVYFKNLHSADGAIHHSGDEREGDALGDDEKIIIALNSVNPLVEHIVFVINSYSEQELDDIAMASCHLFDPQTRKDLATYTLTNNSALDKHTALILADLYRDATTREWMLRILSVPSQGKTARRCLRAIADYLQRVPPQPAAIPPNPEAVENAMPVAVPLDGNVEFPQDDEIMVEATVVGMEEK